MAATGRSSGSSSVLHPLSSSPSQRYHNRNHQRSGTSSPCNLNIRLRFSPVNIPKPTSNQKRKCLCSPTTHPGSFRCAFHRRLEIENLKTLNSSSPPTAKRNNSSSLLISGLNLRKIALVNSLAKIGSAEAERFRRSLVASFVKPPSFHISRRSEFRPRLSRFCAVHKDDQD